MNLWDEVLEKMRADIPDDDFRRFFGSTAYASDSGDQLTVWVPTEPIRLSEVRQLRVHVALTNLSGNPIALDFPTSQRIDIQLLNPAGEVLTRWSENRAFTEEIGNVLINPQEQIVYNETIATRELQPGRVYSVEVFFPKYSELRARQKFMTAP